MTTLSDLMGIFGGKILGPTLTIPIFSSRTWVAPQDGYVIVGAIGAGGSGGKQNSTGSASGGYSGAWGMKIVRVLKNDPIVVVIGAGGAGVSALSNGNAGSATTITIAGITYTAPGGYAGIAVASGVLTIPNGAALPAGWDIGADSVRPGGNGLSSQCTGGAGVDILAQGNNATTSASGGGGTGAPSYSVYGGGAIPATNQNNSAVGVAVNAYGTGYIDASNGEWGISFYGGAGGNSGTTSGANGGGGYAGVNPSTYGGNGGNGGGGGSFSSCTGASGAGSGGFGGGGGGFTVSGGTGTSGPGGNGFACIRFFADMKPA